MTSALIAFLCLGSLVNGQLIFSDDKRLNVGDVRYIKDIDAGYNLASPSLSANSWNIDSPRSLRLASINPAYYDSRLHSSDILRSGTGLSSYTLGGIPAYRGSSIVSLTGTPHTYGSVLANRGIRIQDNARIADDVRLINRPVEIDSRRLDSSLLLARPEVAVGSAELRPVTAAVHSLQRTVDYAPVGYRGEPAQTQVVQVPPNEQGIHINFVSKSSPLTVSQQHIPGESGQVHMTESEDEPHRLVHNVKKAVVQEINEVVQPYRVLKQEVKPVIEEAHTVVAQGEHIPLTGRQSGILASQDIRSVAHQSLDLNSAKIARPLLLSRPTITRLRLERPELEAINVAQPELTRITVTEPEIGGRFTVAEPTLTRVALTQPAISLRQPLVGQSSILGTLATSTIGSKYDKSGSIESPLLGKVGLRRQNLSLVQPSISNFEANKYILSQPAGIRTKITRY